jgi:putative intracellular protease/amidase
MAAAKRVLVPISDDSEEIETTCITDTLTRFGAEVVVASVKANGDLLCKMSRGIKVCKNQMKTFIFLMRLHSLISSNF